ncbi:hypothetical protein EDB84DRAFT_1509016 [Lactarius hengduanensis]|nr:hypothetical protein EDB84DRAFT_1509016 [Lactarius hengduanensis]
MLQVFTNRRRAKGAFLLILYIYVCDGTIDGWIDKKRRENGRLDASSMRIPGPFYSRKVAMGDMRETYARKKLSKERRKTSSNGFTCT